MENHPPQFLEDEWDWRPLARLLAWCIVLAAASWLGLLPAGAVVRGVRELILLWLLSFGLLTRLIMIVVMVGVRLAGTLEDLAFRISDWLVERTFNPGPRALRFASALGVEFALVSLGAFVWNFADVGARLGLIIGVTQ